MQYILTPYAEPVEPLLGGKVRLMIKSLIGCKSEPSKQISVRRLVAILMLNILAKIRRSHVSWMEYW